MMRKWPDRNLNQQEWTDESAGILVYLSDHVSFPVVYDTVRIKCHKIGDAGVNLGPDLIKVSERFKGGKLLQQMLEPSLEVNKQYQTWVAAMNDGRVIAGMLLEKTEDHVTFLPNLLKPESKITLTKADIEEFEASTVSTMPMSLLITYSRDEILDLVAYVQSGGNSRDRVFSEVK